MPMKIKFIAYPGLFLLSTVVAMFVLLVTAVATRAAEADDQVRLIFEQKCQGCHSIGGGRW
jgi:mono/diheme cytochrome c family protein